MPDSHLTLDRLRTIVRNEERLRASAITAGGAPDEVNENWKKLQAALARVPGMPALCKLLEWASEMPTWEELQRLDKLLAADKAKVIRGIRYPEQSEQSFGSMSLAEIAALVDDVQRCQWFDTQSGHETIERLAERVEYPKRQCSPQGLLILHKRLVERTIEELPHLPAVTGSPPLLPEGAPALHPVPDPSPPRPLPPPPEYEFRNDGTKWYVRFGDEGKKWVDDRKGMTLLARLLASPGRWIGALDLERRMAAGVAVGDVDRKEIDSGFTSDEHSRAKALEEADADRIKEMIAERLQWADDAEQAGNGELTRRYAAEVQELRKDLKKKTGKRGRGRSFASPAEKARQRIMQAIKEARQMLAREKMPSLAEHFRKYIHSNTSTGAILYAPPDPAPAWAVVEKSP